MRSKRYDGKELRRVLAAMVTDQVVLSRVSKQWPGDGLFDVPYANLVGSWCVNYFRQYGEPPNGQLKTIYENWADGKDVDEGTRDGIKRLLYFISDEWSQQGSVNSDYMLDVAGELFNKVRVRQVISSVEEDLEMNRVSSAITKLSSINKVELGVGGVTDPTEDFDVWQRAFDRSRRRSLVLYTGALDFFFREAFLRDKFIAFMAPDKSNKSFVLVDVAYRAARMQCNVAYFEVGDLSLEEVYIRLGQRAAGLPLVDKVVSYPVSITKCGNKRYFGDETDDDLDEDDGYRRGVKSGGDSEGDLYRVKSVDKKMEALTDGVAFREFRRACRSRSSFRVSCYPSSSISADGIHSTLLDWARSGWVCDVVVIDYADILAPPKGIKDTLDQIDETWKRLKKISQSLHCCVVTASQSNAAAYRNSDGYLSKKHFSGRKTKLAHVDGMVGINITDEDRKQGVMKFNWIVRRNARYCEGDLCCVAGCLDIGCPTMVADF